MAGHDKITPDGKKFFKEIKELKKLQVRVGYQRGEKPYKTKGKDGEKPEADLVDVAMWNELGTAHSPPRPFLKQSVDNNQERIKAMCATQLRAMIRGRTAQEVLQKIGNMQKGLIQATIRDGAFEANAPATIKNKKSSKPLIDTGHMRQSVNFVIRKKGEGE